MTSVIEMVLCKAVHLVENKTSAPSHQSVSLLARVSLRILPSNDARAIISGGLRWVVPCTKGWKVSAERESELRGQQGRSDAPGL